MVTRVSYVITRSEALLCYLHESIFDFETFNAQFAV